MCARHNMCTCTSPVEYATWNSNLKHLMKGEERDITATYHRLGSVHIQSSKTWEVGGWNGWGRLGTHHGIGVGRVTNDQDLNIKTTTHYQSVTDRQKIGNVTTITFSHMCRGSFRGGGKGGTHPPLRGTKFCMQTSIIVLENKKRWLITNVWIILGLLLHLCTVLF